MARQRFIWPDLWSDNGFASLDPVAQVLYIGCFSNADDEGRLLGDIAFLRSIVFPRATFSKKKLITSRDAMLKAMPKLVLYVVSGVEYLCFTNWSEWQKPKYPSPSRLPSPFNPPGIIPSEPPGTPPGTIPQRLGLGWVGLDLELKALPHYAQQEGHEEKLWRRLCIAAGVGTKPAGIKKLENTVKAHQSTEREIVMAIEAATGPGVNDALAVALSELKKRAIERKTGTTEPGADNEPDMDEAPNHAAA